MCTCLPQRAVPHQCSRAHLLVPVMSKTTQTHRPACRLGKDDAGVVQTHWPRAARRTSAVSPGGAWTRREAQARRGRVWCRPGRGGLHDRAMYGPGGGGQGDGVMVVVLVCLQHTQGWKPGVVPAGVRVGEAEER